MLAAQADAGSVRTAESIAPRTGELAAIQQAFVQCHALQCGYCTAGMLMSARDFLTRQNGREFSDDEARHALSGNICRCGAYPFIIQAVMTAAERMSPEE